MYQTYWIQPNLQVIQIYLLIDGSIISGKRNEEPVREEQLIVYLEEKL